jgi:hypothetical protein
LQSLQGLLVAVEQDVRCMMILGTPDVLTRPWCIAETAISARHKIPTVLVEVNGCTPDFVFDADKMDGEMRQFLTGVGIDVHEVQESFRMLKDSPRVRYNTYATEGDRAEQLTMMLQATGTVKASLKVVEEPGYLVRNPDQKKTPILVATTGKKVEAVATARILVHCCRQRDIPAWVYDQTFEFGKQEVISSEQASKTGSRTSGLLSNTSAESLGTNGCKVLVVLTSYFFDDAATLALVVAAHRRKSGVLGVTVDTFGYEFLSDEDRAKRLRLVVGRVRAHMPDVDENELGEAVSSMMAVIALPLSPVAGSKTLIEAQVDGIVRRLNSLGGLKVSRSSLIMGNGALKTLDKQGLSKQRTHSKESASYRTLSKDSDNISKSSKDSPYPDNLLDTQGEDLYMNL